MQPASLTSRIKTAAKNLGARQQIAIGYAIVVLLMLLFPPFAWHYPGGGFAGEGYHFIFFGSEDEERATINASALAIQLVAVSLITAALWFAAREPGKLKHALCTDQVTDYKNRMNAINDAFDNGDITLKEWCSQRDALLSQQIKAEITSAMCKE